MFQCTVIHLNTRDKKIKRVDNTLLIFIDICDGNQEAIAFSFGYIKSLEGM